MQTPVIPSICACLLALGWCQRAAAVDGPNPPPSRTITKVKPGSAHPTASSFAPRHSSSHVYGAPLSAPILHNRKPARKPAKTPPAK